MRKPLERRGRRIARLPVAPAVQPLERPADAGAITAQLHALVDLLAQAAAKAPRDTASPVAAAREALLLQRRRNRVFGKRLFADPSWEILLDLYVARGEGRNVSVSAACIAASAPTTTALRHIAHLTQLGLLARRPHPTDSRSAYLAVTPHCAEKLAEIFSS